MPTFGRRIGDGRRRQCDPPRANRKFNTCFNALDRHVAEGRADQAALIFDSPVTGLKRTYTYRELLDETARFAGVLDGLGVSKGDRVVVYMPMSFEVVITMLACARIGAVHSVVFGGFAAHELAVRIDDAPPAVAGPRPHGATSYGIAHLTVSGWGRTRHT